MKQKYSKLTLGSLLTSALLSVTSPQLMAGANIVFVNLDGPNEGFNDPTPVATVPGNAGTTLGEQRQNVFLAAMQVWGNTLNSTVDIRVGANFDPQFCTATSATLGSAGPETAHRDFPGAVPNTWYGQALANSIAGVDLATATNDIGATFNSDIDNNCFSGGTWDYRIPSSGDPLSLYSVVLHELAHGLNFLSFVDGASGAFFLGLPDIYTAFLLDQGTNKSWINMTDAERAVSAIGGNLFWTGGNAKTAAAGIPLATGQDGTTQNIKMYAPNPLKTGSSVSHWDTTLAPNELMEPISSANPLLATTTGAFQDMGWSLVTTPPPPQADVSVTQTASADPVIAGNTFTYTITVQNAGPDAATNVVVNDLLPSCVSFLSTSGVPGCAENALGVPNCTLGNFPAGTMDSYDILVDTTACPAGSITNTATVSSDVSDPNLSNNTAGLLVTINAAPPLLGDIDLDGCVGRADITQLLTGLRTNNATPAWDFNGDGQVSRADARSLVQLYTAPNGTCP